MDPEPGERPGDRPDALAGTHRREQPGGEQQVGSPLRERRERRGGGPLLEQHRRDPGREGEGPGARFEHDGQAAGEEGTEEHMPRETGRSGEHVAGRPHPFEQRRQERRARRRPAEGEREERPVVEPAHHRVQQREDEHELQDHRDEPARADIGEPAGEVAEQEPRRERNDATHEQVAGPPERQDRPDRDEQPTEVPAVPVGGRGPRVPPPPLLGVQAKEHDEHRDGIAHEMLHPGAAAEYPGVDQHHPGDREALGHVDRRDALPPSGHDSESSAPGRARPGFVAAAPGQLSAAPSRIQVRIASICSGGSGSPL